MAIKTPDSVAIENTGSSTMHIATFSTNDIDDGDTWASGIKNVISHWATATDIPTSGQLGGIDVSESSGTFTFNTGEDNRTALLFVESRN
jgi:hypothetical protein